MSKTQQTSQGKPCRREYDFALILEGITDLEQKTMDAFYEAGCDDATFSVRYGRVFAEFSREAESYKDAVLSAISDVRRGGAEVLRVNECDLVTPADVARRIGRSKELVSQYISGGRGPRNFPPPECFLAEDKPLWMWCAVSYWLVENQLIKPEEYQEAQFEWVVNDLLSVERSRKQSPELFDAVSKAVAEPVSA